MTDRTHRAALTDRYTTAADAAARPGETVSEARPERVAVPDTTELRRLLEGRVCEARFSDGAYHGAACGLEDCECPEHEWDAEHPLSAGTYITLRLTTDAPVRLGASWALIAPDAALDLADALDLAADRLTHMTEARDNARQRVAELEAAVERVRVLHYPADNDLARTPRCEDCHGKAGTHPCGCWADMDREPVCGHCNQGHRGLPVAWPCPTIAALGGEQS